MLEVVDFSKKYRNNTNYSARHVNFNIKDGEVVGLVGSNGAGKSTIIKSIIGVLPFEEGRIAIDGYDIAKQPEKAKRLIGYVPDDHSVYEKLTGREYVNYMGSLYGASKRDKKFVIDALAKRFEISHALDLQIAGYSHGMKQKICLLGALAHHPKLWILDEPMVGLDHQTMMSLCSFIREYADGTHSVLFSTHNLEVVRKVCDRVIFIRQGQVANIVDLTKNRNFDLDGYYMRLNGQGGSEEKKSSSQRMPTLQGAPMPANMTVYSIPPMQFGAPFGGNGLPNAPVPQVSYVPPIYSGPFPGPGAPFSPASPDRPAQDGGKSSSEVDRHA